MTESGAFIVIDMKEAFSLMLLFFLLLLATKIIEQCIDVMIRHRMRTSGMRRLFSVVASRRGIDRSTAIILSVAHLMLMRYRR